MLFVNPTITIFPFSASSQTPSESSNLKQRFSCEMLFPSISCLSMCLFTLLFNPVSPSLCYLLLCSFPDLH